MLIPVRRLRMRRQTLLLQQPRSADEDVMTVDLGVRAATGERLEVGGWPRLDTSLLGTFHDRAGERVLRVGLDRRREPEDTFGIHRARRDVNEGRLALRERSRLVEDHRVKRPGSLQREAILDEQPVLGAERRGDRNDQRDRQAEGVRAGDHQDRHRPHQRTLRVAEQPPADQRDRAGRERDVEQDRGGPVGQGLGVRGRCLGRGDEPHDPGQCRGVAGRGDPDPE